MSLLSVTVKKARYVGIQAPQCNTYVTLKLQNVKSTTVTVKGPTPCWEQDFLFETNDINLGLLVEVWNKGVIWDRALGYHYLPLTSLAYTEQECGGRWVELEAQLMMRGGAVVGTTGPTGHALLLDCRFEPPFDAEGTGGADLQRKLDLLNGTLDAERAEQARRQLQYIEHSGYSEDSDYTSDLNFPLGQHANCSASQFRNAAHQMHTPQRSLEVSRENSYERDEYHIHGDTDPLYYNSQPRTNRIETWTQLHAQASVESAISWRTAADWQSGEEQRRPSLERQNTLYDDNILGYGYDSYTATAHIGDHSHLSQQTSYEEYFDSSSYPYQTSYVGEARSWDTTQYMYDDGYGHTPNEYENVVNKRRSSVVQLPQVPPKQLPPTSCYSDYNEMAPYRPRQRRSAASLPVTPSSTPKRGRALPMPPAARSQSGSLRAGRGRLLPRPPQLVPSQQVLAAIAALPMPPARPLHTLMSTLPAPEKVQSSSYGCDNYFGYQSEFSEDTVIENNYSSHDEDGMQPFFDETPHATPPAATQKSSLVDSEPVTQFTYPVTTENSSLLLKSVPQTTSSYLPQSTVTSTQASYQDQSYQQFDEKYNEQQYQYEQKNNIYQEKDYQYEEHSDQLQYQEGEKHVFQSQLQDQKYSPQQQSQQYHYQQQRQSTQPLQSSVMTGAATLGSLMAGGAKKLGSLFGAAAAAVAPTVTQPPHTIPANSVPNQFTSSVAPSVTPFSSTITTMTSSVPEVSPLVPVTIVTTSAPITLPRTPSLRRQESIQRPTVRRTRTLPDAPEDLTQSFDESAYDDEYHKTEYDQPADRDRTSLDRYRDEDYPHDTIHEEVEARRLSEAPSPSLQKTASPTRSGSQMRKPSVDSYHSQTPSIIDRRTSQSSFHHEEKLSVPSLSHEESITEKSKVTFKEDRTMYHEVPEVAGTFRQESFDEQGDEYRDDEAYRDHDEYREEQDDQEQFQESDEQYQEEVFQEPERQEEQLEFQPEQPKLTPRQRWHRAYNKIVMQLNVSTYLSYNDKCRKV